MKTGQTIKAFDPSGERTRTMQEKFTRQVLRAAFGCMDLGTDREAKSLGPAQRKIRYDMQKDPFVVNTQRKLVDLAKRRHGLVISTDNQQRIVRPGSRAGSSTDVAPPPQPLLPPQPALPTPFPPQPDLLPEMLTLSAPRVLRRHMGETSSDEDSRMATETPQATLRRSPRLAGSSHCRRSIHGALSNTTTAT